MLYDLPPNPAALVSRAIPLSPNADVRELQLKAERTVEGLSDNGVVNYERVRAALRVQWNLDPVPVTDRGLKVLTANNYTVDDDGCLVLG